MYIYNFNLFIILSGALKNFTSSWVGVGTIWLDSVACEGTETSIADCRHNGWGNHNCDHSEDVSVLCDETKPESDETEPGKGTAFHFQ